MHHDTRDLPSASTAATHLTGLLSAPGRPSLPPVAVELLAYLIPLLAVLAILVVRLVGAPMDPDALPLLLLIVVAIGGWLGGFGPGIVATAAATLVGSVLLLVMGRVPVLSDARGAVLMLTTLVVVTAAVAAGVRRRESATRRVRHRQLQAIEAARQAAEARVTRLARLQRLTEAVARQLRPAEMAARILDLAIEDVGAVAGVVAASDPGSDRVTVLASVGYEPALLERWRSLTLDEGLPVTEAMRRGTPVVIADAARLHERFPRLSRESPTMGTSIAVPLPYEDRFVGALYLRYPVVRSIEAEEISFLLAVGAACAAALERSRLYATEREAREAAERAAARFTFLADSSDALASSLDLGTTLRRLAAIAVPRIADMCAVRLLAPGGDLEPAAVAHADPARAGRAGDLVAAQRASLTDDHGPGAVTRTGRREVIEDLAVAMTASPEADKALGEMVRDLDVRTTITVPLRGRSQVFGAMTLAWSGTVHPLAPDELALADELANRAATALENARLHGDLEAHASRLQARTAEQAAIARLGQSALGRAELDALFKDALETVRGLTGSDVASLVRRTPGRDSCRVVAESGWDPMTAAGELGLDATDVGLAIRTRAVVRLDDPWTGTGSAPSPPMPRSDVTAGLAVPIGGDEGPWGAIALHRTRQVRYDGDEENLLEAIANVLAAAIERDRQERELRARDERLELTLASSSVGTWEWDAAAGRLALSDEACSLHGLARSTVLPGLDAFLALVHPEDRSPLREAIDRALREGGEFATEYRVVLSDGSIRWVDGAGRAFSSRGVPARLLGIAGDISDRKAAEAEQRRRLETEQEARQAGRAFIGVVSHELRTPITSIYAGSKLLQRPGRLEERREEIAHDVEAEAERLYRLTEDLLVLTRLERGDLRIGDEPVLLGHVVRRVAASEQPRWPRVRFEVHERTATRPAVGEESYIEQIARNLLSNAAKYSPAGSAVEIAVAETREGIAVRVRDRGPGVGGDSDQLFELFYRAPQTASQASGAGIGLFVTRRLVEAMGGRLWATTRPGGGAEFGFELRRYDESAMREEHEKSAPSVLLDAPVEAGARRASREPSLDRRVGSAPHRSASSASSR